MTERRTGGLDTEPGAAAAQQAGQRAASRVTRPHQDPGQHTHPVPRNRNNILQEFRTNSPGQGYYRADISNDNIIYLAVGKYPHNQLFSRIYFAPCFGGEVVRLAVRRCAWLTQYSCYPALCYYRPVKLSPAQPTVPAPPNIGR